MLKKKIILGMLVLGSCTACITQARDTQEIWSCQPGHDGLLYETSFNEENILGNWLFKIDYNTTPYTNNEYKFSWIDDGTDINSSNYIWKGNTRAWKDGKIYMLRRIVLSRGNPTLGAQGYINNICVVDTENRKNCILQTNGANYNTSANELYNSTDTFVKYSYGNCYGNTSINSFHTYCLHTETTAYCRQCGPYNDQCPSGITNGNLITTPTIQGIADIQREDGFLRTQGPGQQGTPIACRTINDMIKAYGNKYNTGMCYTPGYAITTEPPYIISTGQLTIFEVFSGFEEYQQLSTIYYSNNCQQHTEECKQLFTGNYEAPYFFGYIDRANQEGLQNITPQQLYQYCHLQLNFTDEEKETEGTCTLNNDILYATGITEETGNPTPLDIINNILDEELGIGIITPTTGSVFDEFLEDGETRLEGISINWIKTFKEAYTKVMGLFKYRQTQQGIIPGYIVSLIAIFLLLALFKK